jgi:hypothetical protein
MSWVSFGDATVFGSGVLPEDPASLSVPDPDEPELPGEPEVPEVPPDVPPEEVDPPLSSPPQATRRREPARTNAEERRTIIDSVKGSVPILATQRSARPVKKRP